MTSGLYCITNKINGKKYFGQSIDIERRFREYFKESQFPNDHLKNSFNKYGKENFEFKIIKVCKEKYLDRFEKLYIRVHDTQNREKGYNKESGGNLNKHPSEETKNKMSEAQKGEKNHFYGKNHTKESRKKMSENTNNNGENNPFYGKKHTTEWKNKLSEERIGRGNPNYRNDIPTGEFLYHEKKDSCSTNQELAEKYNCGKTTIQNRIAKYKKEIL